MENEFASAVGKSAGEIARDVAEFLSSPCVLRRGGTDLDLHALTNDLNMGEQFSFALLREMQTQGWDSSFAEKFYSRVASPFVASSGAVLAAFREPSGEAFAALECKYGSEFHIGDEGYWATVLALALDAGEVGLVMKELKRFTVLLMEVAYMDGNNPRSTYAWGYYESFRKILDDLLKDPEPEPEPIKVCALGGTAGTRLDDGYFLSLGVDLENPNPAQMAWNISLDVTLKDASGSVITVIRDRICCMDPGTVFHYGITRKIRGAAVAGFSAVAVAEKFSPLPAPIMKHWKFSSVSLKRLPSSQLLSGALQSHYDCPLGSFVFHYQFLSADNRILGGGNEWIFDPVSPAQSAVISSSCPVSTPAAVKVVWSVDFDAKALV